VQVAARYLGMVGARSAVGVLEQVALGESMGNHDTPVRVEAIGALAKLGSPTSLTVMEELTRKHGLFGGGPPREVRDAASAAMPLLQQAAAGSGVAS
jgi:HEAT repeat protein